MRDLDLTTLRLYVAVCESRSMARAGEQSHLVASAVSKRMAQLEQQLGTALLQRRRRGVEPTAAGESLLEHARAMLGQAERIEREMAAFAQGVRGQVRVVASVSALSESLADDIADFLRLPQHSDIRVQLEERLSPEIVQGIRDGVASLGVCWDAADLTGLQTHPYRQDDLCVAVHADHPLASMERMRFAQTLDFAHVSLPILSAVQVLLRRAAALHGHSIHYRVVVSNFESALRVVRANLAISIVPRQVAQSYAASWGLKIIPLTDAWAQRRFVICYRSLEQLSPPARAMLDYLVQCAAQKEVAAPKKKRAKQV